MRGGPGGSCAAWVSFAITGAVGRAKIHWVTEVAAMLGCTVDEPVREAITIRPSAPVELRAVPPQESEGFMEH